MLGRKDPIDLHYNLLLIKTILIEYLTKRIDKGYLGLLISKIGRVLILKVLYFFL